MQGSALLVRILSCFYYSTVVASFAVAYLSDERRFMWHSYYPIDYQHSVAKYYALLLFQLISSFLVSFIYSSLDLYAAALYRVLGAHIDVLRMRLESLGETSPNDNRSGEDIRDVAACTDYHNMCIE